MKKSNNLGFFGKDLEYLVITNSSQYYKHYSNESNTTDKWRDTAVQIGNKIATEKNLEQKLAVQNVWDNHFDYKESNLCIKKGCWWTPSQSSLAVAFCNETSIHGFKFMGQPRRHITERIFWLVSFVLSLATAIYLINGVWERYKKVPVIVSFQSSEQNIDSIPFPAVTLCNMNKFPKSKVLELQRIAAQPTHSRYQEARQHLVFVRSVCNAQQSFSKEFHYAANRGKSQQEADNDTISEDSQDEMIDFLLAVITFAVAIKNTIPCDQLIRLCIFGEEERNCSDLFKPIITDYGKCCTFNILPLPLLLHNPQTFGKANNTLETMYDNPTLGSKARVYWPLDEVKEWRKWNYDDGFVLQKTSTRPWKQKRAGLPYGLSLLVDPDTDSYYCPVSDSEGVRFILHTPLEMPHVMEFASAADLNKEILVEVHPDMTNADDDIRYIEQEKRKCYFGLEKPLKFFGPYTGGNCVDECTAIILGETCSCTFFFMPRDDGVRICNNDPDSTDFKCIDRARVDLQETLKVKCGHCDALCEDIAYNYETTTAELQNAQKLWSDQNPIYHGNFPPTWANHKMSVIHIFYGSETTVPKFRKRLFGITDLIANTGGILGLCLGFSVLSGVEVVYFITLRSFWKFCRRRMIGRRLANKFVRMFKKKDANRVIRLNPDTVPVYSYTGY